MAAPDPSRPAGPGANPPWKPDDRTPPSKPVRSQAKPASPKRADSLRGVPPPPAAPAQMPPVPPAQMPPLPPAEMPPIPQPAAPVQPVAAAPRPAAAAPARPVPSARPAARPQARPAVPAAAVPRPVVATEEQEEEPEFKNAMLKDAPPFLISAVLHMLLMIILGLVASVVRPPPSLQLEVQTVYAEDLGLQTTLDSPLGVDDTDKIEPPVLTPPNLQEVADPFAAPADLQISPESAIARSEMNSAVIGVALAGRREGSRQVLLGKYGGNDTTEAAVQRGLAWLAKYQLPDGLWSLAGPYSDGAVQENPEAATAMALLAFQGAGNTHLAGRWKTSVKKGWAALLPRQQPNGDFFREGGFNHRFYTQGQCAIALCELYAMTKDPEIREPAERAVRYLVASQSAEGGWRYHPNTESDLSVTSWVAMALQSAKMAEIPVPQAAFDRIGKFLDKIALEGGRRYPYQAQEQATLPMTAAGMLCRQYLGWPQTDERLKDACLWFTKKDNVISYKVKEPDVYYWYNATQVCHHMEGETWTRWNRAMVAEIPARQVKAAGDREAGSWDPSRDKWGQHGGRLYVTCLSIYMLEVYYRHLPLYTSVYSLLRNQGGSGATPKTP